MSLFSSLNVSLSGLQAITTQMQVVANNVANASNEGYTRKTAVTQAVTLGQEGGGTQIYGFTRASNDALATTLATAISDIGLRGTQNTYLEQVQSILGATDSTNPPLSTAIGEFASAWRQLASSPENNVNQRQVIQAGTNLVSTIKNIMGSVDALDLQCRNDINNTLADLNSDLAAIVDLNKKISLGLSAAVNVGNLQDQRDLLVQKVAKVMNIVVMDRPQGQIALYTPGGYMLVDGLSQTFSYDGTNVTSSSNPGMSLNYALTGGKLQALINFRATSPNASLDPATNVIQKLRSQFNEIIDAFTESTMGPPASFANAYNGIASSTITNGIRFDAKYSGTFGNGVSVQIADTGGGTYSATISVPGQANEIYTGLTAGGAGFWANLSNAINNGGGVPPAPASRLISATVEGTGAATVVPGTYVLAGGNGNNTNGAANIGILSNGVASVTQQGNCISYFARTAGAAGNNISVTVSAGTSGAGFLNVTITDGTTTEVYEDIVDAGGNATWVNIADAINNGGGAPPIPASTLITATAGEGVDAPDALPHALTGGGVSGVNCLTLTSLSAGTAGNNISVIVSQGTNPGTYKVTVQAPGYTTEVYDNIDNSGSGLWTNVANAINQGQAGPPAVARSVIVMATAGSGATLPPTGSTTTYRLANGTNELLSNFFTGTDASTFAVNANLLNGTQSIKVVSPPFVGDSFNASTRTFSADGLNVSGASYESLGASILTGFQQAASNIGALKEAATNQKDYLQQRLTNETSVNVDNETVALTMLQNAYAASAHVIRVLNQMFDILESINSR